MTEPLLTPKDVAEILSVSVDTARNEMRKMRYIEIGGSRHPRLRVIKEAMDEYLRAKAPLSNYREPRRINSPILPGDQIRRIDRAPDRV